mgnify:CR=1 FL=1
MASHYTLEDAVKIANLGAGISVSKLGTVSITINELDASFRMLESKGKRVTDINRLKQSLSDIKELSSIAILENDDTDYQNKILIFKLQLLYPLHKQGVGFAFCRSYCRFGIKSC